MPVMDLHLDGIGEGAWPDLHEKAVRGAVIHLGNGAPPIGVSVLEDGMASGKPSVALRLELPDGRTVVAETSWALWYTVTTTIAARVGAPEGAVPLPAAGQGETGDSDGDTETAEDGEAGDAGTDAGEQDEQPASE